MRNGTIDVNVTGGASVVGGCPLARVVHLVEMRNLSPWPQQNFGE